MVNQKWPAIVTIGDDHASHLRIEGCFCAHQHLTARDDYLERESFGLSENGAHVGGFDLAPSQFQEATFWSGDGVCYFGLSARFDTLALRIVDQPDRDIHP